MKRKTARISAFTLAVILCLGGGLCIWKWDTWFHNPPELPYATPHSPDRIILSLGEDARTERTVAWRCDTFLQAARVEYYALPDSNMPAVEPLYTADAIGTVVPSRAGKSAFYQARLGQLDSGHAYRYRVCCGNTHSGWHDFRIPPTHDTLDFLYIGDVQDKTDGNTGQFFHLLREAYPGTAFWAFAGDIIERPTDAYWSYWFSTMDSVTASIPILAATGNHEYLKGLPKMLDSRWTHTFVNPGNGPRGFEGQTYYIDFPNLRYIVIDTDGIQGPVSLWRHRKWLKAMLASNPKRWTVVMMHHPVHSVRSGRDNYYVRWTFRPLFERYGVQLVLQGHDHGYSRITTKTAEGGKTVPVYVVSSSSPKTYRIGFDPIHDRLGANLQLYQHIRITGDTLHYESRTYDHQLYDDLLITSSGKVIDRAGDIPEQLDYPFGDSPEEREKARAYEQEKNARQGR